MSYQYHIKYSAMDKFLFDITETTNGWTTQLEAWQKSNKKLIEMSTFTGQSASAVKSYLSEVHGFLLQSISIAISRFQSEFVMYKDQYYRIESNIYAMLPQEKVEGMRRKLTNEINYLNNIAHDIDASFNSIADIYSSWRPNKASLESFLTAQRIQLEKLNNNIEQYEASKYAIVNGEVKDLLESLKRTVSMYRNSSNSVISYQSGDIGKQTNVLDLYQKVVLSADYIKANKKNIELASNHQQEVFAQMQKDYEAACQARIDAGNTKTILGNVACVIGIAAIVLTLGAAAPIAAVAIVSGTCAAAYGLSNIAEGKDDVYYGMKGDLSSKSFNPIRDTIFAGNQGAYDLWGNLSMAVAGLCIPVSGAINGLAGASRTVITKTVIKTIGKEIIRDQVVNFGSSAITNHVSDKLNLNQTQTTLLNLGVSAGLDKGLDTIHTGISGKTSFAEGMEYNDAKRYNEYWNQLELEKSISHSDYEKINIKASHNVGKDKVMLGKYDNGAPSSYISKAGDDYTYFDLGDDWNTVKKQHGLTDDDMFKLFNESFLDDGISAKKTFEFSHNPVNDTGALGQEYQYLLKNNYILDEVTMIMSPKY